MNEINRKTVKRQLDLGVKLDSVASKLEKLKFLLQKPKEVSKVKPNEPK